VIIAVIAIIADILGFYIYRAVKNKKHSIKKLRFFNKLYITIAKMPIFGEELTQLKRDLYDNNLWEESISRYKAVLYYLISWFLGIGLFIASCFYFNGNISIIAVLAIFCYYIKDFILDLLIGDDTKLLSCLIEFIRDLKQNNSLYGDIEEIIEAAIRESNSYLMMAHAKRLINAIENEQTMQTYKEECPNEYLKLIALNSFETKEYGDKKDEHGISTFITNLNFINDNINTELFKRRKLKMWLRGIALFTILPLLWFTPIEWWIDKVLPQGDFFYQGSAALLIKFLIIIITMICFKIIRSYEKTRAKRIYNKDKYWEEKLLNIKPIQKMVDIIKPKMGTKKYFKYKDLIARSGSYLKIEWLCLHKVIVSVIVFTISISFLVSIHNLNYKNILKNNYKNYSQDYVISDGNQADTTSIENSIIKDNVKDDSKIIDRLRKSGVNDKENLLYLTQKIKQKAVDLKQQHVKIYEILIILILSIIASEIPVQYLKFKMKLRQYNMENEIFIFETIILILINYENSSVELILDNLKNFSTIFYFPLQRAINNLQKGSREALNELIEEVSYKPFTIIIKNLMKAEDIKAVEAFEDLNISRKNFNEQRKEDNNKLVDDRVSKSRMLFFVPLCSVIVLYMILPMMEIANVQLTNMQKLLN
jgi:hypothetical protein